MRRMKKGISLIVLVITIIVMIILAGSIIVSLDNAGIIGKATEAVDENNLKQAQQIATLAWVDAYTRGEKDTVKIQEAVDKALTDNNMDLEDYKITITENGVTVESAKTDENKSNVPEEWKASVRELTEEEVPIPIGFVKSPYENEDKKDNGLVIYALTEDEIRKGLTDIKTKDGTKQVSLESRNQFVWVPVDSKDFITLFKRHDFMNATSKISYELGAEYWELILESTNMPSDNKSNTTNYISDDTLKEAVAMYESVKKYGGFYIGRYEVGAKDTINHETKGYIGRGELSVTMGKFPYNLIAWGTTMSNEELSGGAVTVSRSFYPKTGTVYGVVSTLTYGVQWDTILNWWKDLDKTFNVKESTNYGLYYDTTILKKDLNPKAKYTVYENDKYSEWKDGEDRQPQTAYWLMTTGAYEKANIYNIYDMAGNIYEWTMEGNSTNLHVLRGGGFARTGIERPLADRYNHDATSAGYRYGCRPALYIK